MLRSFFEQQDGEGGKKEEKDFIVSISGDHIESTKKKEEKKVIPIEEQFAVPVHPTKRKASTPPPPASVPTVPPPPPPMTPQPPQPAAQRRSVIKEMMSHRIDGIGDISDESARLRFDVESRPESATPEQYESLPVEMFGEACLRGQGWKPGDPIGLNAKAPVAPIEVKPRPGTRIGLGATPESADLQKRLQALRKKGVDIEKEASSEKSPFERGVLVSVIGGGRYDGMFAVVKDRQAGQVLVRLQNTDSKVLGAQEVWMPSEDVTITDAKALPEDHPAREFWKKTTKDRAFMEAKTVEEVLGDHQRKEKEKERKERAEEEKKKKKQKQKHEEESNPAPAPSSSSSSKRKRWVEQGLVVRIVSKRVARDPNLFRQKARIVDVSSLDSCILEIIGSSKIVEGVSQSQLETVIPPAGGRVLIVSGEFAGQTADLISRKKLPGTDDDVALVQMHADLQLKELSLDDVCQYTGEPRL